MDTATPTSHDSPGLGAEVAAAMSAAAQAFAAKQGLLLSVKSARTGRYLHVNDGFAALLGRTPAQVLGHSDNELVDAALATALRAADQTALSQPELLTSEHRFERSGDKHDFQVARFAYHDAGHAVLVSLWQDMRALRQRESQLRTALEQLEAEQRAHEVLRRELADQGLRDGATGLYTRAHFEDQLRREVDLSTRETREFSLVFVELDPFDARVTADPRGQQRVLEAMGRLLRGNTRAMDASCRLDERRFAVLLSGVGLATAHSRMEGLRRQCATQIVVLDGVDLGFTVAMGVASFPHTAQTTEEVHAACERSLAEARRRGGNVVALASIRFGAEAGES